jgi:hypothetical protein
MEIQALTTSRGKSIIDNKWYYGNYVYLSTMEKSVIIGNDHPMNVAIVDPASVGLSTGKCDDSKAQRVIFTGDIVSCRSCRCDDTLMQKKLGIIEYDTQSAAFVIKTRDKIVLLGSSMLDCTIVVIGNKTDSPKLFNRINGNDTPKPQI